MTQKIRQISFICKGRRPRNKKTKGVAENQRNVWLCIAESRKPGFLDKNSFVHTSSRLWVWTSLLTRTSALYTCWLTDFQTHVPRISSEDTRRFFSCCVVQEEGAGGTGHTPRPVRGKPGGRVLPGLHPSRLLPAQDQRQFQISSHAARAQQLLARSPLQHW